ncbi:hypothetical protein HPB49_005694 [Dermacentor silvarum]|uniref:Uncharacterized protein n=1 Tax=Dermacentor silvarum TaxID=543639 RepID=A0ACB8D3K5_DERSI|nr:hypothetical protein HPB49_005694 [Dermacentor silvarum]
MPVPTTSFPAMPTFTSDPAENIQRMAAFLHQNMAIMMTTIASHANPVHVTTLPDLSASLPTFNGSGTPTFKHWIEELERIQRLARWEDATLLAIAQGKLRGVVADWHASTGRQLTAWTIWKVGLQEQFGEQLSMIQWQQKVTSLTQIARESLQQYTFAKLKIMSRCPVPITDKERIEYLVQGIRDDPVATCIAVHIISEVDRALDHARLIRSPQPAEPFARQPGRAQLHSATARTDSTVNSSQTARPSTFQHTTRLTQPSRINNLPPADQESRYEAISAKYEPLQFEYEPDEDEPLWSQLNKAALVQLGTTCPTSPLQTSSSSPSHSDSLANVPDDLLTDICLGTQLNPEEQAAVKRIV